MVVEKTKFKSRCGLITEESNRIQSKVQYKYNALWSERVTLKKIGLLNKALKLKAVKIHKL